MTGGAKLRVAPVCAPTCVRGVQPLPFHGHVFPTAFRRSSGVSSPERYPRAASFSSGRGALDQRCCRGRELAKGSPRILPIARPNLLPGTYEARWIPYGIGDVQPVTPPGERETAHFLAIFGPLPSGVRWTMMQHGNPENRQNGASRAVAAR